MAACDQPIKLNPPPPPDDYLVCAEQPGKPSTQGLTAHVLADGVQVYFKEEVDARDAAVAEYILEWRGAWFSCKNQLKRVDDYYKDQDR